MVYSLGIMVVPLWQRNHFPLHHALDGAGYLDDKFLGLAARLYLRIAGRVFQNTFGRFAVNPFSDFI